MSDGGSQLGQIELRNVSKTFRSGRGDVVALQDVSLFIRDGEFLSLVGPSGCGKSTLLRCLCGLEKPTSGRVLFDDKPLNGYPSSLGMVFQRDVLLDWRNVVDNVLLQVEMRGLNPAEWRERTRSS